MAIMQAGNIIQLKIFWQQLELGEALYFSLKISI